MGVMDNLLNTLANFLNDRNERAVLNGQYSTRISVEAGVLRVQCLGCYLF